MLVYIYLNHMKIFITKDDIVFLVSFLLSTPLYFYYCPIFQSFALTLLAFIVSSLIGVLLGRHVFTYKFTTIFYLKILVILINFIFLTISLFLFFLNLFVIAFSLFFESSFLVYFLSGFMSTNIICLIFFRIKSFFKNN